MLILDFETKPHFSQIWEKWGDLRWFRADGAKKDFLCPHALEILAIRPI
jgi:hypothetical protein